MKNRHPRNAGPRAGVVTAAWTAIGLLAFVGQALAALTLSPPGVTLQAGTYSVVQIAGASGEIQAESRNTAVVTVSLTNRTRTGARLNVYGKGPGATTVEVRDGSRRNQNLPVTVTAAPSPAPSMTVSPTSLALPVGATGAITAGNASGSVSATSANPLVAAVSVGANVVTVKGVSPGSTLVSVKDSKTTRTVTVSVLGSGAPSAGARYSLLAWNDLGMHCMDGKDYSIFSILPPFNNLHAQLVNASTGKVVASGVTLTYEAVADPDNSINTTSHTKTNFWAWVQKLYGAAPAADVGLTGNATPSMTARPMAFDAANGWFEATGLPITPYDDAGVKNFYPTAKVTAKDGSGKVLATTTTVLPVSDEITCAACHASRPAGETNPARRAAKPAAGWVNDTTDPEKDWKKNILRLHDEKRGAGNLQYQSALAAVGLLTSGLYDSALVGKPALCASCHGSNALPGTGLVGISALTSALHTNHGRVQDPTTLLALDSIDNRSACYMCHPGSVTKCLRGAMGNAVDAGGNALMGCQSCHGNMTRVGDPSRAGWLQQPNCQACHFDGKRALSALDISGNLVVPADTRYATNANQPGPGLSLFRFSKGHGGLQCEACHGATHAEYPSSHANDNLQSIALQGYAGTVRECTVCHAKPPLTASGGPHGMHTIGAAWVDEHGDYAEGSRDRAQCAYCHGSDYRGGPLAQMKAPRTFRLEHGARTYAAGQNVGCYDCHNGPNP